MRGREGWIIALFIVTILLFTVAQNASGFFLSVLLDLQLWYILLLTTSEGEIRWRFIIKNIEGKR